MYLSDLNDSKLLRMLRNLFPGQSGMISKPDMWTGRQLSVSRQSGDLSSASMKGFVDGLIIGFVIGGALGIMQGWLNDAKTKDLCLLSSSWALNGAAIGAVAITIGNTILHTDMKSGFYVVR